MGKLYIFRILKHSTLRIYESKQKIFGKSLVLAPFVALPRSVLYFKCGIYGTAQIEGS